MVASRTWLALRVAVVVMAVASLGAYAVGQATPYSPYLIVDPEANPRRGLTFNEIPDALAYLSSLPEPEAAGAMILVYPGHYIVSGTLTVTIRDVRIIALDGADRTTIGDNDSFDGPVLAVDAPGVTIQGLQVLGESLHSTRADATGIRISQADCTLREVIVRGNAGIGVEIQHGGDRASILTCAIAGNGRDGVSVSGAVNDLRIADGTECSSNEGNGVSVDTAAGAFSNLVISDCTIGHNGAWGIVVGTPDTPVAGSVANLLVEGNVVSNNKLGGIAISGAPGCAVRHNDIENNVGSGLFVVNDATGAMTASVARNRIASNKGGGLALDMQDQAGPISIVENEFASNQGFGLSALHWPASAAPGLVDLGRNWWGTSDGPSGIFGGTGNAVLGTPPVDTVLAPILPCPMYAGPSPSSMQVLAYPQTAILPLFSAAGTFVIDRLGTAGLRMAFYGGERSAHGWVTMATYTSQALANEFVLTRGRAVRAAAVLVSGFAGGQVEIAMPYDATELGAADPTRLCLYAYEGGSWQAEPGTGELGLVGGELQPLVSHVAVGSHVVIAELDVSQLAGRVSAILLVLRD